MGAQKKVVLRAEGICKSFPGVKALDNVSFTLQESEVHVLLGENGAGKSTLMKIFSGLYMVDSGSIWLDGKRVVIRGPKHAQDLGISIIYQEFNLIPYLTVLQNIFLGHEPKTRFGFTDTESMRRQARGILDFLKVDIDLNAPVRSLGVAQMQLVEVAKALSVNAKVLIMDEPTATLSDKEITNLFETIRNLKARGVSIIYISHRLQEIKQIGDRVTVLRDGMAVGTRDVGDIELDEMIQMMVGRKISQRRVRMRNTSTGEPVLEIRGLTQGSKLRDIDLHVNRGEIVALAGLVGAGRTELLHAVFGIDRYDSGTVRLFGNDITKTSPARAIRAGMGLLPESRKENGLSLIQTIRENLTHAGLDKISTLGVLSLRKERQAAEEYIRQLSIVCPGMNQKVKFLSGGNQQKVVLGKWLYTDCDFLIFDEPTRGIDVGTRSEIYNLMDSLAARGVGILMVSSDLLEILTIADRIYVMREGAVVKELEGATTSQEQIIAYAAGSGLS